MRVTFIKIMKYKKYKKFIAVPLYIVDRTPEMRALTERVIQRLDSAYKPKTWSVYKAMFSMFLSFCIFMKVDHVSPTLSTVLGFIEFLTINGLKHVSVLNYISAVKSQMK